LGLFYENKRPMHAVQRALKKSKCAALRFWGKIIGMIEKSGGIR
jgi:hypothetical protein